ncbi:unnamed protein product [Effrenium voratum]|nr:unnamed protein product [Effrenium voratum]
MALASLEAVPRILSIHEVSHSPAMSSPDGTACGSTPPTPGTPIRRVNSSKRLGDDIVQLAQREDFSDLADFDPVGTGGAGKADFVDLTGLFAAVQRPERLVAELPVRREAPEATPDTKAADQQDHPKRLVAEIEAGALGLRPLPDGLQLDAPAICGSAMPAAPDFGEASPASTLPASPPEGRAWGHLSHKRGRSLDATLQHPLNLDALDLQPTLETTPAPLFAAPELSSASLAHALDLQQSIPAFSAIRALEAKQIPAPAPDWQLQPWQPVQGASIAVARVREAGEVLVSDFRGFRFPDMGSTTAFRDEKALPGLQSLDHFNYDLERLDRILRIQQRALEAEASGRIRPGATVAALCLDVPDANAFRRNHRANASSSRGAH